MEENILVFSYINLTLAIGEHPFALVSDLKFLGTVQIVWPVKTGVRPTQPQMHRRVCTRMEIML